MAIDQIIIIISLIVFFIVGRYVKKQNKSTIKQYTINERKLGWFKIAAGISMTFAGGAAILNTASLGYTFKWYTLVDPIALILGIIIAIFLYNKYRNDKGITISDLLSSKDKKLNVLIGIITSFVFLLIVAANFVAISKLLAPYFPNVNPRILTLLLSFIVFSYVYWGGFTSVTRTDILQLFFIGIFLIIPIGYFLLFGVDQNENSSNTPHQFISMPLNYIILFSIPILFTPLSQDINIRIKSSKDKRNGILGLLIGALFYFIIILATSYIGIRLGYQGVTLADPESAYGLFFKSNFQNFGFLGIIAAMAAIVSSLDSYALNGITSLSNDILSKIPTFNKRDDKFLINISAVLVYLISLSIALFFNEILVIVLTALLIYISVLFPIAFGKMLKVKEIFITTSAILIILFIVIVESFKIEIEPKTIIYPAFGLLLILISYFLQKIKVCQKEN